MSYWPAKRLKRLSGQAACSSTKTLIERAMNAEMSHHVGYEKHAPEGRGSGNNRNGNSSKRVQGDFGAVEIEVPRDRTGPSNPRLFPSTNAAFLASTRRFCRCTRAA